MDDPVHWVQGSNTPALGFNHVIFHKTTSKESNRDVVRKRCFCDIFQAELK